VSAGVKAAKQNIYNATERDKAGRNKRTGPPNYGCKDNAAGV